MKNIFSYDSYFGRCTKNQRIRFFIATVFVLPLQIIAIAFMFIGIAAEKANEILDIIGKRFIKWDFSKWDF